VADPNTRASDGERERVARQLRNQCTTGRLSIDELEQRLGEAYQAVTVGELAALVDDLPTSSGGAPTPRRRIFWPGIAAFSEHRRLSAPCRDSYAAAMREIVPRMGTQGFHLEEEVEPRRLLFVSDHGLRVTVMFVPAQDGGTEVSAFGHAPRAVRRAFANLSD